MFACCSHSAKLLCPRQLLIGKLQYSISSFESGKCICSRFRPIHVFDLQLRVKARGHGCVVRLIFVRVIGFWKANAHLPNSSQLKLFR